jgi:hypothetical protein
LKRDGNAVCLFRRFNAVQWEGATTPRPEATLSGVLVVIGLVAFLLSVINSAINKLIVINQNDKLYPER